MRPTGEKIIPCVLKTDQLFGSGNAFYNCTFIATPYASITS